MVRRRSAVRFRIGARYKERLPPAGGSLSCVRGPQWGVSPLVQRPVVRAVRFTVRHGDHATGTQRPTGPAGRHGRASVPVPGRRPAPACGVAGGSPRSSAHPCPGRLRDPTVDESGGAALLGLLDRRSVTIRAWAYGDQWIGAGTAKDAEDVVRPVLVTAPRRTHAPQAVEPVEAPGRAEDWVERLIGITGWTMPPRRPDIAWAQIEARLGTRLPTTNAWWRPSVRAPSTRTSP